MRKPSHVLVVVATVVTLVSVTFAVVAAVSSANSRTKPVAERIDPTGSSSTSAAPPGAKSAPAAEVSISDFAFGPSTLEIAVGATVTWTNRDDVAHTVSTKEGPLGSPDLENGDTYSVTVDQPGAINYYCDIHQYMRGTITVAP